MAILSSKWFLGAVSVVVALAVASLLSRKSVHTELVVSATPEEIWSVLTDSARYPEWNPVLVEAEGVLAVGEQMTYQLREPSGRQYELKANVRRIDENRELNQAGGMPGVLTFNHQYLLEPVEGGTKVTQHEEYRGLGVWFWDETWVTPAYASVNEALRDRAAQLR